MLPGPLNLRLLVLSTLLKACVVSVIGGPLYSANRLIEGNTVINRVEKLCYRLLPNEDLGAMCKLVGATAIWEDGMPPRTPVLLISTRTLDASDRSPACVSGSSPLIN
jgi:hypothetical protein